MGFSQPSQRASSVAPSSSRLRALAEYDAAMADSEAKRKRESEENQSNSSKTDDIDTIAERRREKLKTMLEDERRKGKKQ